MCLFTCTFFQLRQEPHTPGGFSLEEVSQILMNLKKDSSVRKITAILYCNPVSNLQKIAFHNTKSDNTCRIESSSGEFRK